MLPGQDDYFLFAVPDDVFVGNDDIRDLVEG